MIIRNKCNRQTHLRIAMQNIVCLMKTVALTTRDHYLAKSSFTYTSSLVEDCSSEAGQSIVCINPYGNGLAQIFTIGSMKRINMHKKSINLLSSCKIIFIMYGNHNNYQHMRVYNEWHRLNITPHESICVQRVYVTFLLSENISHTVYKT